MSDELLSDELADIRDRLTGIERLLLKRADSVPPDPLGEIPDIEPPEANTGNTWQDFIKSLMPLLLKLMERDEPTAKTTPPPPDYYEAMDEITGIKEKLDSDRFDINSMKNTLEEHRTHLIAIDRDVEGLDKQVRSHDNEPTVKVIPPPADYIGIATRLTTLEERLREVSAKQIQELMERIAGLDRDMEIYKGSIDRIRTDIDKLDSHLIEHNRRISELEAIRSPREAEQATERLAERIRVLEQAAKKSERIQ